MKAGYFFLFPSRDRKERVNRGVIGWRGTGIDGNTANSIRYLKLIVRVVSLGFNGETVRFLSPGEICPIDLLT